MRIPKRIGLRNISPYLRRRNRLFWFYAEEMDFSCLHSRKKRVLIHATKTAFFWFTPHKYVFLYLQQKLIFLICWAETDFSYFSFFSTRRNCGFLLCTGESIFLYLHRRNWHSDLRPKNWYVFFFFFFFWFTTQRTFLISQQNSCVLFTEHKLILLFSLQNVIFSLSTRSNWIFIFYAEETNCCLFTPHKLTFLPPRKYWISLI